MITYSSEEKKETYRILYISYVVPPIVKGPSVLIYRLLRCFPDDSYLVLTSSFKGRSEEKIDEGLWLPVRYVYAFNSSFWRLFPKLMSVWSKWKWLQVPGIFFLGMKAIRKKSVKHLLVAPMVYWGPFLLATCLLHRISRIPMSIYFFDISEQGENNWENRLRSSIVRIAVHMSLHVFVMSEPLQEYYRNKYSIEPILLPHPVDLSFYNFTCCEEEFKTRETDGPLKIVFTGMIYEAQLGAIINLVKVVRELPNVEFHIYTPVTKEKLHWMGIMGEKVIYHGLVSQGEIPAIQREGDILFMPIAFDYSETEVIKTASPSKLPEYLAAGRPILIHAPEYSYVAWYGKKHKCAEVVDIPDLEKLRKSILRLKSDGGYRNFLVSNARKSVLKHKAESVSIQLQHCMGIV